MLSVVVPALNEAERLPSLLESLAPLRERGHELIVVDGGSGDGTAELARPRADRVLAAPRGRARQMNAGAAASRGEALWFLHADSLVGPALFVQLERALAEGAGWGRFDVRLSGGGWPLRLVERGMNLRSRLTGIATGDQGLFVRRRLFEAVGGYPDIPLMEDVALSGRLRRRGRPACLPGPLVTSSRRWEEGGVVRTVLLMWRLRLAYLLGADPGRLHARYYPAPRRDGPSRRRTP